MNDLLRKARQRKTLLFVAGLTIMAMLLTLGGCALFDKSVSNFVSLMKGRQATILTYNVFGQPLDRVHGAAIDIQRDGTFDSVNPDGTSNADSSVVKVSVGGGVINHVGSTLLMVEDGLSDITAQLPPTVDIENTERGVPFLNYLRQNFRNFWAGTSRTIMVRSQNGSPIAIFGGNQVEYFATNIPKSTLLRIDGKYLLIYRSDYTLYDNKLLDS
jgi:hypothetical protein